jgi:DNA repair protein RecN (Recombination protein N)
MLKRLYIKNFTLYKEINIDFTEQLTVITGETGAGKSIFLDALGLALGNRADGISFYNKNEKCVIEALFDVKHSTEIAHFLNDNDYDAGNELILRREITQEGKSRSFINDSPSSLNQIKHLNQFLIDIHSQHQSLLINQQQFQFKLIDTLSKSDEKAAEYKVTFKEYQNLKKELDQLKNQEADSKKELDYLRFQLNELLEAGLENKDMLKLEEECSTLENAENIRQVLSRCIQLLDTDGRGILYQLNQLKSHLRATENYGESYTELLNRASSILEETKDLHYQIEGKESEIEINPSKLEETKSIIDTLNHLLAKHQLNDIEQLINLRTDLQKKVEQLFHQDSRIIHLEKELDNVKTACQLIATELTKKRTSSFRQIEKSVLELLKELSMPNARFKIENNLTNNLTINGYDNIEFKFSANLGSDLKPVQKTASGGELSRLMLCLKSMLAVGKDLPSIIFDEIDSGVSGDVANKMGKIFTQMSKKMQVVAITHLPQIASCGSHHLYVYKQINGNKTTAVIKALKGDERIVEIAKMLSSDSPTDSAIKNAKDLLKSN